MAVTKQTYTATATWTAAQLATLFENAFIDAGLMTAWHDTFLNTVENRVLRVVYDAGKTYGTTYYWFMFTTGGVFIHTALDWNTTTKVPAGTLYLDYFSTTTNSTANHRSIISLTAATAATLTRYTSSVNSSVTWFVIRNGSTSQSLFLPGAGFGPSAFVDLNKVAFNGAVSVASISTTTTAQFAFLHVAGHTRRTFLGAEAMRNSTTVSNYIIAPYIFKYSAIGNVKSSASSNLISLDGNSLGVWLPTAAANTNVNLASDHRPVFTSPTISPYLSNLPSDFGVVAYYASNSMAVQDTFVVSSGTEEWEMLSVSLNAGNVDASKILLLARTT